MKFFLRDAGNYPNETALILLGYLYFKILLYHLFFIIKMFWFESQDRQCYSKADSSFLIKGKWMERE